MLGTSEAQYKAAIVRESEGCHIILSRASRRLNREDGGEFWDFRPEYVPGLPEGSTVKTVVSSGASGLNTYRRWFYA